MDKSDYLNMQRGYYNERAKGWSLDNREPVVGNYDAHESFPDYDTRLFRGIEDTKNKVVLEYGCGPGRNLARFASWFARIDGADISEVNIIKAREHLVTKNLPIGHLWKNNGESLFGVEDSTYDVVFSVICLQHIACHEVRFSIMEEIYRVLKPEGVFTFQMGFGNRPSSVNYYENNYGASGTNGDCDVRVEKEEYLKNDLAKIGFLEYNIEYGQPCCDRHDHWIWVQARK